MSKEEIVILKLLESVNRPSNINDILQNLHKEVTKNVAQKALDKLVYEGKVKEKCYSKQKIYAIVQTQDQNSLDTRDELKKFETEILEKSDALQNLEEELRATETELRTYQSNLTTSEAEMKKAKFESLINNLQSKLTLISKNELLFSKTEHDKLEKHHASVKKICQKRKQICLNILNSILENYPKSKSVLIDEIGIEMDDDIPL